MSRRLPKSVLAVAGALVAVGLLALAAPRTVRAVAAALVEITNTASNPAITQSTNHQATQLVSLFCTPNRTAAAPCNAVWSPAASNEVPYVVPDNQYLVITSVDITADDACPNGASVYLIGGGAG